MRRITVHEMRNMKVVASLAVAVAMVIGAAACSTHMDPAPGPTGTVFIPRGLDSAGTAKFIEAQRKSCKGRLDIQPGYALTSIQCVPTNAPPPTPPGRAG
jgi:hypothetical protein